MNKEIGGKEHKRRKIKESFPRYFHLVKDDDCIINSQVKLLFSVTQFFLL